MQADLDGQENLLRSTSSEFPLRFDYQSSTPCDERVLEAMRPFWYDSWGNASNQQNRLGLQASAAVSLARERLAACLGVSPSRVIFTSGATEANNLALLGLARARSLEAGGAGHLITMQSEHRAVLEPLRYLKEEGFSLTELIPGNDGLLSKELFSTSIRKDTYLVSIMIANNEIGVIQPIEEIAELCKENNVIFHTDASQAFGHIPILIDEIGIDLMSISAHKFYGPKGIGALIIKDELPLLPLQFGGGQERGLRPGTIPVPLVVGMAKAAELAIEDLLSRHAKLHKLRDQLLAGLRQKIPELIINGSMEHRLPHNLNITFPGISGSRLIKRIRPFINSSSGSACMNGLPSHVLLALGRSQKQAEASLRLSLGRTTTPEDVNQAVKLLAQVFNDLK